MDCLAEGKCLTEPQIFQINKLYASIISNKFNARQGKKISYTQRTEKLNYRKRMFIEEYEKEKLKWRERKNPTIDAEEARVELKRERGKRKTFYAQFERYGKMENWYTGDTETTILLKYVTNEEGTVNTAHLWIKNTKRFQELKDLLKNGTWIKFEGRIMSYKKGYFNAKKDLGTRKLDYTIKYITKIELC
jgi:hypothetical protein